MEVTNQLTEMIRDFKKGEVYWVEDRLQDGDGSPIDEYTQHPYVIVSDTERNEHGNTVLAVMLSTHLFFTPTRTVLCGYEELKVSIVKAESIFTISKALIGKKICNLRQADIMNIDRCLKIALGFDTED